MNPKTYISIIVLLAVSSLMNAQISQDSELYQLLKSKDSILFDAAFNRCDVETMESLFTEDFEFYHDRSGFTDGREAFLKPTRENCEKRNPSEPQPSKRILIEGSLEVYPLHKDNGELYGAIQHGVHRFVFLNENKEYQQGDIAKFTHVWMLKDGEWKIKRELSYNHQSSMDNKSKQTITLSEKILAQYEGMYKSPQAGMVKITQDHGHLLLQSEGFEATLLPETENVFFIEGRNTQFKFEKENNKIAKMVIVENDTIVDEAKKQGV